MTGTPAVLSEALLTLAVTSVYASVMSFHMGITELT
jgi:hypothetical protein